MNFERGGPAFVGCLFIGMGIGYIFDGLVAGAMIGMGAGFLLMAMVGRR